MASLPHHRAIEKRSLLSCLGWPGQESQHGYSQSMTATANNRLQTITSKRHPRANEMQQTEDFLAAEFNKLSIQERMKALDDVYGAGKELNENPALIEASLAEFERQLQHHRGDLFPTYEAAVQRNRAYVQDPSFRLKFLRANMHDVNKAAHQMEKFLMHKATYFGIDTVAREITLHDLNEEDMKCMLSGLYHIQDGVDRHNRPIFYDFSSMASNGWKIDTLIRVLYFIWFNILISSPVVQEKGAVLVYYGTSKSGERFALPELNDLRKVVGFSVSVPIRFSAIHICLNKAGTRSLAPHNFLFDLVFKAVPQYVRARIRIHYGSHMEHKYELKRYSIPPDTFPMDADGNLQSGIMNVWFHLHHMANDLSCTDVLNRTVVMKEEGEITNRAAQLNDLVEDVVAAYLGNSSRARENEESPPSDESSGKEQLPFRDQDVLLGRGWEIQTHPGNVRFREFLARHQVAYDKTPRCNKRGFAANLANILIRTERVRFLKKSPDGEWEECTIAEAEKKVGDTFRSLRKRYEYDG